MPDALKLSTQWLETDAAFGVAEVPLAKAPPQPAPSAPALTASVRPTPTPMPANPPTRPTAPARPAASSPARPQPQTSSSAPLPEASSMAKRKPAIALPPVPEGDIANLPPLSASQKEAAFEKWLADLTASCKPLLNDIATNIVPGEGDINTPLLFVGEGPGTEEDRTGRPFVGKSGELLNKMIVAMGFTRESVYIANIVKLRCASFDETLDRLKDRPPTPEEAARGLPFLHRQIEIIRPRAIVTLGATAIKYLTNETRGVMSIRGTWQSYRDIPVMPTYHPAFVLRNYTEETRRKVWQDLQEVVKLVKK